MCKGDCNQWKKLKILKAPGRNDGGFFGGRARTVLAY